MNQIEIPKYVDDPPVILLWSVDEITPLLAGLFLGMQIGQAFLCTALGLLMTHCYRKCLDASQDGFLANFLYWHGLWSVRGVIFPNPFIREFR